MWVFEIDSRNSRAFHFGGQDLICSALDDPFVILFWMQNSGRKLKAASAFYTAVTGCSVASLSSEDSADVARERELAGGRDAFDLNL